MSAKRVRLTTMERCRRNQEIVRARRQELRDADVPNAGRERTARTNLGLELLMRRAKHGVPLSNDDIAAWCGCTPAAIHLIEKKALRSARRLLTRSAHVKFAQEVTAA